MKSKLVALILFVLFMGIPLQAQLKGDGPKTAIIQYDYIVGDDTMGLVQYSDNYGALLCFKYDYMGAPFATIVTNDSVFEVSYSLQAYKAYERPEEDLNFNALTPDIIKKYNIQATGTVEFLGKTCTVYTTKFENRDVSQITVWVYKGLELRRLTEYTSGPVTDLVATQIEENAEVSADTFKIPAGFQLFTE